MEETLIEKVRQRTFLYDTKSPYYRYQHMRANAWEGIGKESKIKRKFYVSSRDVRIVCPRLKRQLMSRFVYCPSVKVSENIASVPRPGTGWPTDAIIVKQV